MYWRRVIVFVDTLAGGLGFRGGQPQSWIAARIEFGEGVLDLRLGAVDLSVESAMGLNSPHRQRSRCHAFERGEAHR